MKRSKSYTWLSGLLKPKPEEDEWGAAPWVRAEVLQHDRTKPQTVASTVVESPYIAGGRRQAAGDTPRTGPIVKSIVTHFTLIV
ncbi:unnamed protein product, partial [Brenthis ino]